MNELLAALIMYFVQSYLWNIFSYSIFRVHPYFFQYYENIHKKSRFKRPFSFSNVDTHLKNKSTGMLLC